MNIISGITVIQLQIYYLYLYCKSIKIKKAQNNFCLIKPKLFLIKHKVLYLDYYLKIGKLQNRDKKCVFYEKEIVPLGIK